MPTLRNPSVFAIKTSKVGREILRLKWADPFRPFEIRTRDGKRRRVTYDMQVTVTPLGDDVAMYDGSNGFVHFPLSSVVGVKPYQPPRRAPRRRPLR